MDQQRGAFLCVEGDGLLHDFPGFVHTSQFEEHPSVGVEVGGVVVREGRGAAGHGERLFQIALLKREEIGVIVQHHGVVGIVAQAPVIGFVALLHGRTERAFAADLHEILVVVGLPCRGFLVPGVADHSPDRAAQRIGVRITERLLIGFYRFVVLLGVIQHMAFRELEVDLSGEKLQRPVDVEGRRVGMLEIALDVDHRPVVAFDGRLVVEVEFVERQRLFQFA